MIIIRPGEGQQPFRTGKSFRPFQCEDIILVSIWILESNCVWNSFLSVLAIQCNGLGLRSRNCDLIRECLENFERIPASKVYISLPPCQQRSSLNIWNIASVLVYFRANVALFYLNGHIAPGGKKPQSFIIGVAANQQNPQHRAAAIGFVNQNSPSFGLRHGRRQDQRLGLDGGFHGAWGFSNF